MGKMKGAAIAALAVAMSAGQVQAAANDCWSVQEVSAAKVRDLQTMLMVAGLRCRGSGSDVLAGYNRFVATNRSAIVAINNQLKAHFNSAYGPAEGQRSYDRFTTALANAYGAGGSGTANCNDMVALAEDAADAGGSSARLLALAEARELQPDMPTRRCSVVFAAK
jgi:predicted RNase H-like nuclease